MAFLCLNFLLHKSICIYVCRLWIDKQPRKYGMLHTLWQYIIRNTYIFDKRISHPSWHRCDALQVFFFVLSRCVEYMMDGLIVQCVMCTQSLVSSSDFRSQNSSFSSIFKNFSTENARKIKRPSALILRKFWKIEAFVWISILHYKLSFQV